MSLEEVESNLYSRGYSHVVGVDEAGRGPLAGPVVAAACCIPFGVLLPGVRDSKRLSSNQRARIFAEVQKDKRILFRFSINSAQRIDQINILEATLESMKLAVDFLGLKNSFVIVDGNRLPKWSYPSKSIVRGDQLCQCIAVASIIAKEIRDQIMLDLDQKFPEYGFKKHKGYGTSAHRAAIEKFGPCQEHRYSFAPLHRKV